MLKLLTALYFGIVIIYGKIDGRDNKNMTVYLYKFY
jgi:hypothetical protein